MSNQETSGLPTIEAALGLRARAGSREALLRAAFDLVDTSPGMRVIKRSLVWRVPTVPTDELAAAISVRAQLDIPGLEVLVERLQTRVCPPTLAIDALRLELLWAHDPNDVPHVVAIPPVGPDEPERPPMPEGRIFLHPEVPIRASACGPLAEVAEEARDPATTRFASEYLETVPPPFVERPQPFTPTFVIGRHAIDGGRVDTLVAHNRADLLAAAAEAFARAPASAEPIGPTTLLPVESADTPISLTLSPDASLDVRLLAWLRAVEDVVSRDRLVLRRAVVIEDGPLTIHGVLFGVRSNDPPVLGRVHAVVAREDPDTHEHRAEITVLAS
jgi:hypothetical protein